MSDQEKENKNVNSANAEKAQAAKQAAAKGAAAVPGVQECAGQRPANLRDKIERVTEALFPEFYEGGLSNSPFAFAWWDVVSCAIMRGKILVDTWYDEHDLFEAVCKMAGKKSAEKVSDFEQQAKLLSWLEENTLGLVESVENEDGKFWRVFPAGSFFSKDVGLLSTLELGMLMTLSKFLPKGYTEKEIAAELYADFDPRFFLNVHEANLALGAWLDACDAQKTVKEQKK